MVCDKTRWEAGKAKRVIFRMNMRKNSFYNQNAGAIYLEDKDKDWFCQIGAKFLDQNLCVGNILNNFLFHPGRLEKTDYYGDRNIVAPLPDNYNFIFPGSPETHDDVVISGVTIREKLEACITPSFGQPYLLSAIPEIFCCIRLPSFSYEVFNHIYTGNMTTPFAIVSEDEQACLMWDFDLEYSILSTRNQDFFDKKTRIHLEKIHTLFDEKYSILIPPSQRHEYLIKKFIRPNVDE